METKLIPGATRYCATACGMILNAQSGYRIATYATGGYRAVAIKFDDGKRKGIAVHRCVVSAWLGPIPKGMWVNHKNGIKADNCLENLEVGTPSHNHCHARDVLKRRYARGDESAVRKLNATSVEAIRQLHQADWSQHKLANAFEVSQPTIHGIVSDKAWCLDP